MTSPGTSGGAAAGVPSSSTTGRGSSSGATRAAIDHSESPGWTT